MNTELLRWKWCLAAVVGLCCFVPRLGLWAADGLAGEDVVTARLDGQWEIAGGVAGAFSGDVPPGTVAPLETFVVRVDDQLGDSLTKSGYNSKEYLDDIAKRGHRVAATGLFDADDGWLL